MTEPDYDFSGRHDALFQFGLTWLNDLGFAEVNMEKKQ